MIGLDTQAFGKQLERANARLAVFRHRAPPDRPCFGITTGVDNALTGQTTYERPNQVLANPYTPGQPWRAYLNPNVFKPPAPSTYGNMGANNLVTPRLHTD